MTCCEPCFPWPSHTDTKVKSTLFSHCWGANGLPIRITDPRLLLHLLSPPSAPLDSVYQSSAPLPFVLLSSLHHSFQFLLRSHIVVSLPPPGPRSPRAHVLMEEYSRCIVLSHPRPCFDNGSFDSFPNRVQSMAATESWKPCSYQKEHVNGEAIKPTSD